MNTFGVILVEIPKHGVIGDICLRMLLVTPIHGWELDGIADEEDWQIIEDKILNALLCVKLGSPSANIADGVARSLLSTNSRNTGQEGGYLSNSIEKFRIRKVRYVLKKLKLSKSPSRFSMNAPIVLLLVHPKVTIRLTRNLPLWDSFPRKMG